jgi:raffinose/stachyose/melibiose transport system substrate-binding protein
MKNLFAMLLLAVVVISFSFAQEKVTVWGWRPQDVPLWQKVERILQSRGVKVSIDYQPFLSSEYFSKLYATLQGGSGPDIMYTGRLPKFPAFVPKLSKNTRHPTL